LDLRERERYLKGEQEREKKKGRVLFYNPFRPELAGRSRSGCNQDSLLLQLFTSERLELRLQILENRFIRETKQNQEQEFERMRERSKN